VVFFTWTTGVGEFSSPSLLASCASLTFTLSPATNALEGMTGFSGTLSVTGTPPGSSKLDYAFRPYHGLLLIAAMSLPHERVDSLTALTASTTR
jgi:hypothetical protein